MTTSKPLPWAVAERPPWVHLARSATAAALRAASAVLAALAQRVAAPPRAAADPFAGTLEFHAEAGALEGALYVDGELVGHLPGVRRL